LANRLQESMYITNFLPILYLSLFLRKFTIVLRVGVMVFNITLSNISVISWQLVLLVEETKVPRENHRHAASN